MDALTNLSVCLASAGVATAYTLNTFPADHVRVTVARGVCQGVTGYRWNERGTMEVPVKCGHATAVRVLAVRNWKEYRLDNGKKLSHAYKCPKCRDITTDRCGRDEFPLKFKVTEGTTSPHVRCDARCMNSKGSECQCACGGAHHGVGWAHAHR